MKGAQSCPTLCDSTDCRVHGILQDRIREWVAFPFSKGSSQLRDQTRVSRIAAGFFTSWSSREAQEYWSGYLIPSPADLPDPGNKLGSPELQADSLPTRLTGKPERGKVSLYSVMYNKLYIFLYCNLLFFIIYYYIHSLSLWAVLKTNFPPI